jgi:ATP/maltotriose-dependent transcriptional regulator MalT
MGQPATSLSKSANRDFLLLASTIARREHDRGLAYLLESAGGALRMSDFDHASPQDTYRLLSRADRARTLSGEDLERLANSAYLLGKDDEYLGALERAHRAHAEAGANLRAVRCAFWLGLRLMFRGEAARANGWLSRAQRMLECEGRECVEHGYLLLPAVNRELGAGNPEAAYAAAERAAAIGDRFGEADLSASARHLQGRVLIEQGQVARGLALLDEAMLAVSGGGVSPLVAGLAYCSVIDGCQQVYALARAHEWTSALAKWCDERPQMVAFTGVCMVHRAEIMQMHGAWNDAMREAQRACERCAQVSNREAAAAAYYQRAEVYRMRGEFAAAEDAYRAASQWGWEPQPGLALLRLAQGRVDAAAAAMRRVTSAAAAPSRRARLLPAHIEVMLAADDPEEARRACRELGEIARSFGSSELEALAAQARGAIALAEGDPAAAVGPLRDAWRTWQQAQAPYAAARTRMLLGLACRALGDEDGAKLELGAARAAFAELGAAPDLARIDSLGESSRHGLTPRELQVLRLVATGKTNKAIAAELSLSEKTIDRHVSNIFAKLDVASRAAATAYAYQHRLM